jgi:hypothetical protein
VSPLFSPDREWWGGNERIISKIKVDLQVKYNERER